MLAPMQYVYNTYSILLDTARLRIICSRPDRGNVNRPVVVRIEATSIQFCVPQFLQLLRIDLARWSNP
jgi:hypothetical protein